MNHSYELKSFDRQNPPPARVVADLHGRLLPTSPAARLGSRFLEQFYYRTLVEEGALHGTVAWVDAAPAGFIAAADDSAGFMRLVLKRRFLRVGKAGVAALLRKPSRVTVVLPILRLMTAQKPGPSGEAEGEILSMGVEEEFRRPRFISTRGHRISFDLLDHELERMRQSGVRRVRAVVDSDNLAAQLLYRHLGWTLTRGGVPGWERPTVEFSIELQ